MSGRNEYGKWATLALMMLACIVVGMKGTAFAQMLPGAASMSVDPELEFMLQQQRMLADEIGVLESQMEMYPVSEPGSELVRESLSANLDRLKTDIVEIDQAITERRALIAEDAATQGLSDPMDPAAAFASDPRFRNEFGASGLRVPELGGVDPRDERDQMLYMLQRDRLEEERQRLIDRLARLRPNESTLADVLQRQLFLIEADLEALDAEFVSDQSDAETEPPLDEGLPPLYPGMSPPVAEGAGPTVPQFGLTGQENDIMIRRRLLFEAADNLRLAGFQDLANQAITAADGLLNMEMPPLGTPEYGGPGFTPDFPAAATAPGDISVVLPENSFGMPDDIPPFLTEPEDLPPLSSMPSYPGEIPAWATVEPPVAPVSPEVEVPPVEIPEETPAPPSDDDELRAQLEMLRAQLEAINSRLDQ